MKCLPVLASGRIVTPVAVGGNKRHVQPRVPNSSLKQRRRTHCRSGSDQRGGNEQPQPGFVRSDDKLLLGIEQHWKDTGASQPDTDTDNDNPQPSPTPAPTITPAALKSIPAKVLLQHTLQLAVIGAALILWPAWLQPGGLSVGRVWQMYLAYFAFFGVGSVHRMVRHGDLTPRHKDKQVISYKTSVALALFILFMPMIHWTAVTRYVYYQWYTRPLVMYDVLAAAAFSAAISLHVWAARTLGKDFDRVVTPSQLVTWGPYRWMQHPIYTSYILLFVSFCFAMHTAPTAVVAVLGCYLYYGVRCSLEAGLLSKAFGEQYRQYTASTKRFIPGLL